MLHISCGSIALYFLQCAHRSGMAMSSDEAYHVNERQLKDSRRGKRKTYNSSRHSRDNFQERLDFKFYDFQALEIEKGWNQLFVSIISIETGETIAKSGKALVQNGQCQWEDSMLTTIWISDYSLEDNEGCLLKLIVAMGSPRFGTLGEATINLASYIMPQTCTASLPLIQHCSNGAILQVKIQCLTPIRNYRKDANSSYEEEMSVGYDDIDNISDVSDTTFSRTSVSSLCEQLENTYSRGELGSKGRSSLTTCSDHDVDSLEIENSPQKSNVSGWKTNMKERQDSTYSKDGHYSLHDASRLKYSSSTPATSSLGTQLPDKMEDCGEVSHASDTRSVCSSKDIMGAAQVTIELLHGEVKMWEENARKLMIDMERLQKDLKKKSKNKKDLEMELSASRKESDDLKEEIQRLTTLLKQNDSRNLGFQIEEMDNVIKELKGEIKYHKELNHDLEVKLKNTQESNNDLVSILQKSKKKIEKQKMEITDLSMTSFQFQDTEKNSHVVEDSEEEDFSLSKEVLPEKMRKEFCHSDVDLSTNENAIRCLHEGIELQELGNLELERQLMQEKQKSMESTIRLLQKTLDEKDQKIQTARRFMARTLEENEANWRNSLFEKEKQIINFEKKLHDGVNAFSNEISALTQRVQDLERNLAELESSDDEQNAVFGVEAENVQLSERIPGLEAEVRHLNEEKVLTHLALENSENVVMSLQAEIRRMETINEAQKVDLKRMEESMQKTWIEAQEECSFLKVANLKLQATNNKLVKESKTLQTTNGELRMQSLELHDRYTVFESKLEESQIAFSGVLKLVEDLEYKFTSMQEEIALKEETINVDLDALLEESIKQYERFNIEERLLTHMYLEKTAEVVNLQREVEHLRDQISGIFDRHKRIASTVVLDVYELCADKAMIEAALLEEQERVKLYEAKLDNLRAEYAVKVQNYTEELAATRANHETLMANHEEVVVLLENSKSNEEKLKSIVRGLKEELKASELDRLQAAEEISELEVQLQKTEMLQDELFILKRSLYETEFENRRLEASYEMLSLEYDELKAKKISYMRRLSTTEKVTSELEDCKRSKVELEEKILRLEWDLTTKEASSRNNAQLRYELAQMTRENDELREKKDSLQQQNQEYQKKVKALDENLKQKGVKQGQYIAKECSTSTTAHDDLKLLTERE